MNPQQNKEANTEKKKMEVTNSDNNRVDNSKKKRFMWKNKCVTEAVYNLRMKQQQNFGKRKNSTSENNLLSECEAPSKKQKIVLGRRIIDLDLWIENDKCKTCGHILSLANIIEEKRHGLASLIIIRCQDCLFENSITTDKTFTVPDGKTMYEINARIALGKFEKNCFFSRSE